MFKRFLMGTKLLCLLLCLSCLAMYLPRVGAAETGNKTLTTLVRMTPESDGAVIGLLEHGRRLTLLGSSGGYFKVDCYDMVGYIAKSQVSRENEEYYVNCQEGSGDTRLLTYREPAEVLELRHSLLALAKKQLGSRYVYGSERPGAFDCSGLTSYLYKQHGIKIQRRASLQLQDGIIVPKEAMQVGDLVFFREGTSNPASHVGIYAGNGKIIHAGTRGGVEYASLDASYYAKYFLCARRIVHMAAPIRLQPVSRGIGAALTVNSVSGRSLS